MGAQSLTISDNLLQVKTRARTRTERALAWASLMYLIGLILNWFAFHIYGRMPVYYPAIPDGVIIDARHVSGFSFIGDYILIGRQLLSPGDVLLYIGMFSVSVLLIAYVVSNQAHHRFHAKFSAYKNLTHCIRREDNALDHSHGDSLRPAPSSELLVDVLKVGFGRPFCYPE